MGKRFLFSISFALFTSCFTAGAAYAQESTQPTITKPDSATINETATSDADTTDNKDANSTPIAEAATGKDTTADKKEAYANSTPASEVAAGKDISTDNGPIAPPSSLSDKKIDRLISKYAEMISLEPEDVKNYPLYRFINDWYGVKYKWGGSDNSGIDCSAFSQKLYGKIYSTNIERTARQQHKSSEKIKDYGEANEGDLVFFRIHHIRITHVGIYLANGYFVHASRSHGVVISSLDDRYWRSRYAGCGRISKQDRPATESDFAQ